MAKRYPITSTSKNLTKIKGYDFNEGINYQKLMNSHLTTGFQATNLGLSISIINEMIDLRRKG